jgi:EAL and modified HD-GYP domain-containing signal transduction protein
MQSLAYLARQPILDRDGNIFAYELLFRNSPSSDTAIISSDVQATAQVLENVLNSIGLERLVGRNKAFINCSREMLLNNLFGLLNPGRFVLEILEDVSVDNKLIYAIENHKSNGFELALDDFIMNDEFVKRFEPLFKYISYVKMDVVDNPPEAVAKAAHFFKEKGIKLLAEKVEDGPTFKHCKDAGYNYFQGFYFAKPELVTGQKIDATSAAILEIIQLLHTRPTFETLCNEFDCHPDVSANLLQFVNADSHNSPAIDNVKNAIIWVGMKNIQDWLMLMLYAHLDTQDAPAVH